MSINVFEKLLIEKIENFILAFSETSEKVFFDDAGKQIHPGEFGKFREDICKEFIRFFVPHRLDIGEGFLITSTNKISTQCDIVIYDATSTPLIKSDSQQKFYPVETVAAIGEVKSILSKNEFKTAINKLSKVKELREDIQHPVIIKKDREGPFDPIIDPYDQIFTFTICKKLNITFSDITSEINSMYDSTVEYRHRHNLILSVEDGLLAYYDNNGKTMMYPWFANMILKNRFTQPDTNPYSHFKLFSSYLFLGTTSNTILYPEISDYMGCIEGGTKNDEI